MAASLKACRWAMLFGTNSDRAHVFLTHIVRGYARGIKRTPVAVRTPTDDLQLLKAKGIAAKDPRLNAFLPFTPGDPTQTQLSKKLDLGPPKSRHAAKLNMPKKQTEQPLQKKKPEVAPSVAVKEVTKSGLQYEKLQDGDKRFGRVLMAAKSKKEREKCGLILLEGRRLILDSLNAGARLKYLYFTDASLLSRLPSELVGDAELYKVQYRHLKLWADTQTPAGVLGVFAKPAMGEVVCPQRDSFPLTLICDNIRDPGNLGTIIRTAAAVGCRKIITTKGCVDVWDPKVLRGAMGGHFYTCILTSLPWEEVANHIPSSAYLCIADTRKDCVVEKSFDTTHPKVMNLLNTDEVESSSSDEEDGSSSDEESSSSSEDESSVPDKSWSDKSSEVYERVPMSVVQYSDMDCAGAKEIAVVVGGETEGVSNQARKLAFDLYGQYVTIPMVEAADSLNTATAAAVVLYEARRRLTMVEQRTHPQKLPGKHGVPVVS
ncbi:rRNA methyltransferase 3, mitochondrial-like [Babylonia areolata]|uniref:rRNA methyltransferase 3, mitochondrial-like n=1 Tax=Babylonia areolata TaxID=304850 RepID=UPI003FD554B2